MGLVIKIVILLILSLYHVWVCDPHFQGIKTQASPRTQKSYQGTQNRT
jgi:hypothetical protein